MRPAAIWPEGFEHPAAYRHLAAPDWTGLVAFWRAALQRAVPLGQPVALDRTEFRRAAPFRQRVALGWATAV